MKIALVHDYLRDFGGAERVLRTLSDIYPKAPIYVAFYVPGSAGYKLFNDRKVIESKFGWLIKYFNLYSPLRFLLPQIWRSFDLSEYDVVITSCSNYIARGFKVGEKTKVIAYCHTPPRFLYGYKTGIDWQKFWPVRVYGQIIGHFLRIFDFESAMRVDYWIANSVNVAKRISKFYRKVSVVIYPPVEVSHIMKSAKNVQKENFFLIVSRLVGTKGIEEAVAASSRLGFELKIVGATEGILDVRKKLERISKGKVEFLGRVSDSELWNLYARAKGFIALARDEDFGITVVEAQAAGTPVIAFNGGGFKESVVDGKTGILINDTDVKTIEKALRRFNKTKWSKERLQASVKKFSKERFKKEVLQFVNKVYARTTRG